MNFFQSPMFHNMTTDELEQMQEHLCMHKRSYKKNAVVFHMGDCIHEIGIVIKGSVNIENIDLWGNKSILSNVPPGQIFAETYALSQEPLMVNVVAVTTCEILFMNLNKLMDSKNAKYSWYTKILANLLQLTAYKNLTLSNRIFCTTAKTIRSRLCSYLSTQSVKAGSIMFQIPFNRQQLADYLNVDRSALSKELGKMQAEGYIEFYKNTFKIRELP